MIELFPSEILAGVTFGWTITDAGHPAPDHVLIAYLRGPEAIDLAAVGNGATHVFGAAAGVTAGWTPGPYFWAVRAVSADGTVQIANGRLQVLADIAAQAAGYDPKTHAERVLAAIEAVIEGRATVDQQFYMINNRSISRTPIADLLKLRAQYRAEVARERAAAAGRSIHRLCRVRFT